MARRDKRPNPEQFGTQLRRIRQQAGITQRDLAGMVRLHHTMVGKIELGIRAPHSDHAEAFDAALETDGVLTRLWHDLYNQRYVPDWFRSALPLERRAVEIRQYQPMIVPGPLQTEAYARTMVEEGASRPDAEEVERVVKTRVGRLPAIAKAGKAELISYVIREAVLTDVMGDETIMREQLRHILKQVAEYNIEIQVLPASVRRGIKVYLPFQVLTLDSSGSSRIVGVVEHAEGGVIIDDPHTARRLMTRYGQLQAEALSPSDSIRRIREILETHYENGDVAQE